LKPIYEVEMNNITLQIPSTLQAQLELLAQREGVSLPQYLVYALTRQVSLDFRLEKVAPAIQQAERERFAALLQRLGTASEREIDAALAEREVAVPEAELTPEVIARLQERIAQVSASASH
jgi:hypothetical protein